MTYTGPIVDAHHHLWDYAMGRHKWLGQASSSLKIVGDSRYLERDYLPADYAADASGQDVVGAVHVEAHWDRTRDSVEETEWLDTLTRPGGLETRYVAFMALGESGFDDRLGRHTRSRRVAGVRESIREHADPAFAYAASANWRDPLWQANVARLQEHGLVLELLLYAHQDDAVCQLAQRFPALRIVINHSASPIEPGAAARARYVAGLNRMAQHPNVHIKVSNFFRYTDDLTFEQSLTEIALPCIEAFGDRAMFGSDFPVASKWVAYADLVTSLKRLVAPLARQAQQAFFHDTAWATYRFGS